MYSHPFAYQPLFDHARLGLVEHTTPVTRSTHKIVDVYVERPQPFDELDRRDASADDDGLPRTPCRAGNGTRVVERVKHDDAVEIAARHVQRDRG